VPSATLPELQQAGFHYVKVKTELHMPTFLRRVRFGSTALALVKGRHRGQKTIIYDGFEK